MIFSILAMILLALPGFLFVKKGILTKEQSSGVGKMLMNYFWPCMVVNAMVTVESDASILAEIRLIVLAAVIAHCSALIFGLLYGKIRGLDAEKVPIFGVALGFSNTGFIGMPLINSLFGAKALMLASFVELVNDILLFTVATALLKGGQGQDGKKFDLKAMISPGFISVIAGALLFAFQVPLPKVVMDVLGYAGGACTAVAMFAIGGQVAEIDFKWLLRKKELYECGVLRLLVIPAAVCGLSVLFLRDHGLIASIMTVMFAMPSASVLAILTAQYKRDYILMTEMIMFATIFCMVTVPFWTMLTEVLFTY